MKHTERGGRRHKDLQLCRQVQDAISYALSEFGDPVLDELALVSVEPAPNASRLLVTLAMPVTPVPEVIASGAEGLHYQLAAQKYESAVNRLRAVSNALRQEVTAEINRKRSPELIFRVV
jgi:ribosome-binding factor A